MKLTLNVATSRLSARATRQYILSRHPCRVVKDASEVVAGFDQETYISEASYVDA